MQIFFLSVNASLLELGNNGAFTLFWLLYYVLFSVIVILGTVWLTKTVPIKGGIRRNGIE
jgi:hypothetical protein